MLNVSDANMSQNCKASYQHTSQRSGEQVVSFSTQSISSGNQSDTERRSCVCDAFALIGYTLFNLSRQFFEIDSRAEEKLSSQHEKKRDSDDNLGKQVSLYDWYRLVPFS